NDFLRYLVASRSQLDRASAALHAARAAVSAREAALDQARTALSFSSLRAPVGGRVVDRLAERGDTATPGAPLLRIYDPSSLRVEVPVRESLAVSLRLGQELDVEIPALPLAARGAIEEIVPFADPGARTLLVKVGFRARDERVLAGMFARVAVPSGTARRVLVPRDAVHAIGQLRFVDVAAGDDAAERRLVTVGPDEPPDRVEVLSGLRAGERVWTRPAADADAPAPAPTQP
ncbi:MAG: efflux RND transporter periplasmic adaptor subunit, partial [Myxococcales bacterium]|nr:efflux RND transporter periplasmic adaptor subunit [Myxococcales bacterium]